MPVTAWPFRAKELTSNTFKHEGREIKLCCKDCLKTFKQNPAKYIEKLDAEPKPASS